MKNHDVNNKELVKVFAALKILCQSLPPESSPEEWPRTRDIADYCDVSIYISRYYLMRLVKEKKARVTTHKVRNSLRWNIW